MDLDLDPERNGASHLFSDITIAVSPEDHIASHFAESHTSTFGCLTTNTTTPPSVATFG